MTPALRPELRSRLFERGRDVQFGALRARRKQVDEPFIDEGDIAMLGKLTWPPSWFNEARLSIA